MTIHLLNCFTSNARWPSSLKTGLACLLVETDHGPVLVDTGLGLGVAIWPLLLGPIALIIGLPRNT